MTVKELIVKLTALPDWSAEVRIQDPAWDAMMPVTRLLHDADNFVVELRGDETDD